MYEKFFQFSEPPFNLTPDPHFFFFSKKHEEAFDHIRYGIQERKGFIVVTGEVGTGKTTLSRLLLEKLDKKTRTAMIFNPSLSTIELLQAINHDFGIAGESSSKKELVESLNQFLLGTLAEGGNALLLVDEGQNLSIECLEEIRMLSNLETETKKLLQILLIGQPELREKLQLPGLRQLNQRIAIRYHIEPLNLEETKAYVSYRLNVAGGRDRLFFTPKSLKGLYQHSGGVPRLINILCDKGLLAAYAQESHVVDETAMDRAVADLEGPPPAKKTHRLQHQSVEDREAGERWFTPAGVMVIGLLLGLLSFVVWGAPLWFNVRTEASIASNNPDPLSVIETVEPRPVPGVPPSDPVVSDSREGQSGRFDGDGVYRVVLPEDTRKAALLTLLRIWGDPTDPSPEAFKGLNGDRLMSDQGFSAFRLPVDLERIRLFDYPCLIYGHWTRGTSKSYVVLAGLTDHDATVLDPLNGKTTYGLDVLPILWEEEGTIYWKPLPGITLPLKAKGMDPSVKTIQKALRAQGLYPGEADGKMGIKTKRAVRFFQQKYGLRDDGVFNNESFLALSKAMFKETPGLRNNEL